MALSVAILALFYFFAVPMNFLTITSSGGTILYDAPVGGGESFILRFIHSVERTPIESEYRVVTGKIVHWEERFLSHNAGLPTEPPRNGRFIMAENWMILRGGGPSAGSFRYRVGNEELGRNLLFLPNGSEVLLYVDCKHDLLLFRAELSCLFEHYVIVLVDMAKN